MTETCTVYRNGILHLAFVRCRVFSDRLLADQPDPQDANMRSIASWGFTMPSNTDVRLGDRLVINRLSGTIIDVIVGEVVQGDTWEVAMRAWGNRPKIATPQLTLVLWRWNEAAQDFLSLPAQAINIVYDRNEAVEPTIRYSPAGQSSLKGGFLIGGLTFDVKTGDRFDTGGSGGVVTEVLPHQPQRIEARFVIDTSGLR
ncbi:MAG: hypothetical protein M3P94_06935 [Chloroflexota bacterium]|nr:hypothetical protein [Chloroflexota bacterium]